MGYLGLAVVDVYFLLSKPFDKIGRTPFALELGLHIIDYNGNAMPPVLLELIGVQRLEVEGRNFFATMLLWVGCGGNIRFDIHERR
jgi:hypothetical protein